MDTNFRYHTRLLGCYPKREKGGRRRMNGQSGYDDAKMNLNKIVNHLNSQLS
jgi:hypothetical protein